MTSEKHLITELTTTYKKYAVSFNTSSEKRTPPVITETAEDAIEPKILNSLTRTIKKYESFSSFARMIRV